ncbi:asparaginase domain-containing protein [Brachybacterium sp. GPGPB12]|uniref:asparaginase n=1 Tax=Brachybacterium sp. GPGPB12 TaxID=3023517 RepID=UPI00313435C3
MSPFVEVLSLGGTIFMTEDARGESARPDDDAGARLLAAVGGDVEPRPRALANISSSDVRPHHLRAVLESARAAVDSGAAGVVLTHGTDTLEETAFLLDRFWDREAPLVVTGAMRPASAPGADGPANLRDAVRAATALSARGLGVLVVFDAHAHLADRVVKASSRGVSAFASEPSGPLAIVGGEDLRLLHLPPPRPVRSGGLPPDRFPAVPPLTAGLDEDLAAAGPPPRRGAGGAGDRRGRDGARLPRRDAAPAPPAGQGVCLSWSRRGPSAAAPPRTTTAIPAPRWTCWTRAP